MKLLTYISLISILILGCKTQNHSKINQEHIYLSQKYQNADSLNIQITYRDFNSCIENQSINRIHILFKNGITFFKHHTSDTSKIVNLIKGKVFSELQSFERQANQSKMCGGQSGGHGIIVTLKMNFEEYEFGYCKDNWDGINELINKLNKRVI